MYLKILTRKSVQTKFFKKMKTVQTDVSNSLDVNAKDGKTKRFITPTDKILIIYLYIHLFAFDPQHLLKSLKLKTSCFLL